MSNTPFASLSGGIPNNAQDFAASIIFTVAFAVLIPICIFRLVVKETRTRILIRPLIFCLTQAVAYGMRAAIANGSTSTGIYEASEILLLAGFSAICEPIPALLTRVAGKYSKGASQHAENRLQQRVLLLCRLAITVALILGIVASTDISANESQSTMNSIKQYRIANAALIIGAISTSAIIAVNLISARLLQIRAVVVLVIQCALLIITAAYKLGSTLDRPANFSRSGKIVFYILTGAVEWLATLIFFAVNINQFFPPRITRASETSIAHEQNDKTIAVSLPGTRDEPSKEYV
ncbi:uncharacterized protein L969DRAFT_427502 [Mixia osmundae IAM 14324]|uniref:DUF7702 domain-containing protein n=1 Tax=Mixia osmundae (strain CBS 9802 / IAM 14324 / JCM 22182 / KY 12970) TaxID=764103 RepID=G7E893_MIXOS|nr:uncharacterized protein L969DRAFT_427502 [Mixia osmundae IAM 14324]KEI39157.1 hypothetical protein L969DRAFT_427502 [Mixia osmundae IAM 14324]GAA99053.1 hypothetical protein E5Q_05742 [Mixia osmundae IAM 14324]